MKTSFTAVILVLMGAAAIAQPCITNTGSLSFNGTASAATINGINGLDITASITVEAWVYASSFAASPSQGTIFCKHRWDNSMYGYVLRAGGQGILSFNIAGSVSGFPYGWVEVESPPNALTLNAWHHVAGTYDGAQLCCYVDGILQSAFSFSGGIYSSGTLKPRIGRLADTVWGQTRMWNGMIDEVRVWNRALSMLEIQSSMNDHIDPSTAVGLAGYWRLNEAGGNNLFDLGPGGNNGYIFGATWSAQVPFNNGPPPVPVITYSAGQLHSSAAAGNQWYLNDTLIPGANLPNYTPAQYGNYTVEVTGLNGCASLSVPFTYNTSGIQPEAQTEGISVFPNPFTDQLNINGLRSSCRISIFDGSGRVLRYFTTRGERSVKLDLSGLSGGSYRIKINGPAGSISQLVNKY